MGIRDTISNSSIYLKAGLFLLVAALLVGGVFVLSSSNHSIPSSVSVSQDHTLNFSMSSQYTPGSTEVWNRYGLDEREVFHKRLIYSYGQIEFEIRVGKGGQIYSIITSQGEVVGAQNTNSGGEWVDRVMQPVYVNSDLNKSNDKYFIHGAGTYERDGLESNYFSPILDEWFDEDTKTYNIITWPQQAHIPTNFKSNIILHQKIRALPSGVIEFTYISNNFANDKITFTNNPWFAVRTSNYPFFFFGNEDRGMQLLPEGTIWGGNVVPVSEVNGWLAGAASRDRNAPAIGLIFGGEDQILTPDQYVRSPVARFGYTGSTEDLGVWSLPSFVEFDAGEVMEKRFYFVVNRLSNIHRLGNQYTQQATYSIARQGKEGTKLNAICAASAGSGRLSKNCAGKQVLGYTYQDYVSGSVPLMEMRDRGNRRIYYTNNPNYKNSVPYKSGIQAINIMGWVPRSQNSIDRDCFEYESLTEVVDASVDIDSNRTMYLRTDNNLNCSESTSSTSTSTSSSATSTTSTTSTTSSTSTSTSSSTTSTTSSTSTTSTNSTSADSSTTTSSESALCRSDFNEDEQVNLADLAIFVEYYNKSQSQCRFDIVNDDCVLNLADLASFTVNYRKSASCSN